METNTLFLFILTTNSKYIDHYIQLCKDKVHNFLYLVSLISVYEACMQSCN